MRRAPCPTLGLAIAAFAGVLGVAGSATAQESAGDARGLRYLSWPGRDAVNQRAAEPAAPVEARSASRDLRRPNRVIPHGGVQQVSRTPPAAPAPARRTLTPASAWLQPPPAASDAAPAASTPEFSAPAATAPAFSAPAFSAPAHSPAPVRAPVRAPAPEFAPPPPPAPAATTPLPEYFVDQGGQPTPAAVVAPAPATPPETPSATPSAAVPDDPWAPRRDAPIFRIQRAPQTPQPSPPVPEEGEQQAVPQPPRIAAVTANPADRPAYEGARYYSVHRQNGRSPDALELPEPTYVDALAITMTQAPTTPDLAAPDPGPTLIRDREGRIRHQPAAPEGDYQ